MVVCTLLALAACEPDAPAPDALRQPAGAPPTRSEKPQTAATGSPETDPALRVLSERIDGLAREIAELRAEIRARGRSPAAPASALRPRIDVGELSARFAASTEHAPEAAFAHAKALVEGYPDAPQTAPAFAWLAERYREHDSDRYVRYLRELVRRHPRSEEAAVACLALAHIALENGDADGVLAAVAPLFDNPNGWQRSGYGFVSIGAAAAEAVREATQGTRLAERGMDAIRRIATALPPTDNVNSKDVPAESVADTEVRLARLMQNSGRLPDAISLYREIRNRMEGRSWARKRGRLERYLALAEQGRPAPD